MKNATIIACILCLAGLLTAQTDQHRVGSNPQVAGQARRGERILPGSATRIKQPLGYSVAEETTRENFLEFYEENYIRPRAYPEKEINSHIRTRAYEQLRLQRQELKL